MMPFGGQKHRRGGHCICSITHKFKIKGGGLRGVERILPWAILSFILTLLLGGPCLTLSAPHLLVDFPSRSHWLCGAHVHTCSLFDQWLASGRWTGELISTHQCSSLHQSGRSVHPNFRCPQPEAWRYRAPQAGKPAVRMRQMSARESLYCA